MPTIKFVGLVNPTYKMIRCKNIGEIKMEQNKSVKRLVDEKVTRHDGDSGNLQSLLKVKNLKTYRLNDLTTSKKAAFTLAETLITLAVIGIVAAMTIPTLINNYQEKVTIVKVKKIYSVISNAYEMSKIENGDYSEWGTKEREDKSTIFADKIVPYLKINKICGYESKGCFPDITYNYLTNKKWYYIEQDSKAYKFIMTDGTLIALEEYPNFGKVFADVNGFKGPNILGKDVFGFYVLPRQVIPVGADNDINKKFVGDKGLQSGDSAPAWVIQFENMDYLHCEGLSFDGKHKCSD